MQSIKIPTAARAGETLIKIRDRVLNAGFSINNYQPVAFEELDRNNELRKEAARDSEVPHAEKERILDICT